MATDLFAEGKRYRFILVNGVELEGTVKEGKGEALRVIGFEHQARARSTVRSHVIPLSSIVYAVETE